MRKELSPTISVITVVRNGETYIEETIKSVASQTYPNIEHIIIDGNSTDNTVNIIRRHENALSYWISEPDAGIYDAMNKGVSAAKGDWLLFINADDFLASPTSIDEAIVYLNNANNLIVYGNVIYLYPDGSEKLYGTEWDLLKYRFRNVAMYLAHQATFHSKQLFLNNLFDTSFKIAGDYDFLLRHLKDNDATYIPVTIAKMRTGGLSYSVSKIELLRDTRKAQIQNKMYNYVPSLSWIISGIKLVVVDTIIKIFGIRGKNLIKKFLRVPKG
jgi:glycosyltransferase involved in cell wall biosynthesis